MHQAQTLDSLKADCASGAEHLRLLLQKRDRGSQGPLLLVTFPFCHGMLSTLHSLSFCLLWVIEVPLFPLSFPWKKVKVLVTQSCPTLWDPMDCSLSGSSVNGDSLGKNTGMGCHFLLWGSSRPRDRTQVSCTAGRFFTIWAVREAFIAVTKTRIKNGSTGDFCGGPVGKTVHFQCWGPGFEPWLGN